MVSVDGSPELVYATEDDNKITNNSSGTTSQSNSSSPIIVDVGGKKSALILTENLPKVKGVIVVSSGAGNVAVKLNILNAVSTLMDISVDKVSVLKGL
jgi:stage III sporulation protein AG